MNKSFIVVAASLSLLTMSIRFAAAACDTQGLPGGGTNVVCTPDAPNPWTNTIGGGRTTPPAGESYRIEVQQGSEVSVLNKNGISVGDNVTMFIDGTVRGNNNNGFGNGNYGTGLNLVEGNSNMTIEVGTTGSIIKTGNQNNAEAINLHGFSNQVENRGVIQASNSAAIWFQDVVSSGGDPTLRNIVSNYGTIERVGGGAVMGTSAGNGIIFYNNAGGVVKGDLSFAQGNDDLIFEAGSSVTGNINGGGGENKLVLTGSDTGTPGELSGWIRNFQTLTKDGTGTWIMSGPLEGFRTATVDQGILRLTGNNTGYTGSLAINTNGTVEARAQSLPSNNPTTGNVGNVTNNGTLRFIQNDTGTYVGQIIGSGRVEMSGTGTTTLAPEAAAGNTYSGGTFINSGTLAISKDSALGATSGGLTMGSDNSIGTLQLNGNVNLDANRQITLVGQGGAIDTQGFTSVLSQDIDTTNGTLYKRGSGVLVATGSLQQLGGTVVDNGTLQLGNGGTTGDLGQGTSVVVVNQQGTLAVNRSDTYTLANSIGGAGKVAQQGTGTTILTGNNLYSGGTLVQNGTLQVSSNNNLGNAAGGLTLGTDSTNGTLSATSNLNLGNRQIQINAGGGTINTNANQVTSNSAITGAGGLTKQGAGSLVLTGDSTYSGGTTIAAGTLQLGNGGTTGSIQGDVANQGTLVVNQSGNVNLAGVISGSGNLIQRGTGTTVLAGTNTYAGNTAVENGVLSIASNANLGANSGNLTLGAASTQGTLQVTSNTSLADRAVTLNQGGGTIDTQGNTVQSDGVISGAGKLTKQGAGNLVVTGTNTYSGGTTIAAGTLQLGNGGTSGSIVGNIANQGTLVVNRSNDVNLGSVISGSGNLIQRGSGTTVLSGANSYAGGTSVENGVLSVASNANLGAANGGLTLGTASTNGTLSATSNLNLGNRQIQINAGGGTINTNANQVTSNSAITGAGGLTKQGAGSLVLTGDSTYSGGTTIASGTLQLGNGGDTGSIQGNIANQGTLIVNHSGNVNLAGVISGSGNLIQRGTGTTVLAGTNTYTGNTAVEKGVLSVASNANLGAASGNLILGTASTQGTLRVTSSTSLADRAVTLNQGGGAIDTQANTVQADGVISGAGRLTKQGSGSLVLTSDNTYTGGTTIAGGTLQLGNGGNTGDIQGNVVNNGLLVLNRGNDLDFNQQISGTGAVIQDGTGVTTLSNGNTYAGGTQINAGTMAISADSALGAATGNLVFNGGTLRLDDSLDLAASRGIGLEEKGGTIDTQTFDSTVSQGISGSGELTKTGAGHLILTGSNTYTGGTVVDQGTLQIGNGGTTGSLVGNVTLNNSTLAFNRQGMLSYDGDISGTGNIHQKGPGELYLTGNSGNYNDDLYVSGGSLGVVSGGQLQVQNAYVGSSPEEPAAGDGTLIIGDAGQLKVNGELQVAREAASKGRLVIGALPGYAPAGSGVLNAAAVNLGSGEGSVVFNHSNDNYTFDTSIPGGIVGNGTIDVRAGRTILSRSSAQFSGETEIHGGALQVNNVLGGTMQVLAQGTLEGNGTVGDTSNAGIVAPGRPGASSPFETLTIAGNYNGLGGILVSNTRLDGDDSPTSLLHVRGDTLGNTSIKVNNQDGHGTLTREGIKIVDVDGDSSGNFSLIRDYTAPDGTPAVIAGAYGYGLYQGSVSNPGDGDWYLRSFLKDGDSHVKPPPKVFQPGVPVYEAYPQVLSYFNRLSTLQQRVGNRMWSNQDQQADGGNAQNIEGRGVWGRIEGSKARFRPSSSTADAKYDLDSWRMQLGVDVPLHTYRDGSQLIGGVSAHYGKIDANASSIVGRGKIESTGYGLGGTLTWYLQNGVYVDTQAQVTWFDSDIRSKTLGVNETSGNDGVGYAFSVESGREIPINQTWSVTPQAQLVYSKVDFDSFNDAYNARVSSKDADSLEGRAGIALNHQKNWVTETKEKRQMKAYGIANLYHEFLDGTEVQVSNQKLRMRNDRNWVGVGVGGSYNWKNDKHSVYAELGARSSLDNFADSHAITGEVGVRFKF